jgi:hypothetical protein
MNFQWFLIFLHLFLKPLLVFHSLILVRLHRNP